MGDLAWRCDIRVIMHTGSVRKWWHWKTILLRHTHLRFILSSSLPQHLKWSTRLLMWKQDLWCQFHLWLLLNSHLNYEVMIPIMSASTLSDIQETSLWLREIYSILFLFWRHLSVQAALGDFHLDISLCIFTSFVIPFAVTMSNGIYPCYTEKSRERNNNT